MSEVWPRDPRRVHRDVVMAGLHYRMTFIDQLAESQVEVRSKSSPPVLPLWFRIAFAQLLLFRRPKNLLYFKVLEVRVCDLVS